MLLVPEMKKFCTLTGEKMKKFAALVAVFVGFVLIANNTKLTGADAIALFSVALITILSLAYLMK